jgi:hypothetical protein
MTPANLMNEDLVRLSDAAWDLPHRPHTSTLFRWMKRGVRGVRLEAVRVGGGWFTSREAVRRFIVATTAAAATGPSVAQTTKAPSPPCNLDARLDGAGL